MTATKRHSRVATGLLSATAVLAGGLMAGGRWLNELTGVAVPDGVQPSDVLFYVVAAVLLVSAAGVAFTRDIVATAISLLVSLLAVGALYVFVHADYLAVTQLLLYVGGVLVLILFAVMLTQRIDEGRASNPRARFAVGFMALAAVTGVGLAGVVLSPWYAPPWSADPRRELQTTVERLGTLLIGHYALVFELLSVVLLAVLVGAVVVARRESAS